LWSTNKYEMRKRFTLHNIPQPDWMLVDETFDPKNLSMPLPVMVKAIDRSGKCGITKVETLDQLIPAINYAIEGSHLADKVLIEEYLEGKEYTVESISQNGRHCILSWTEKFSEPPHFVEEMHLQPADLDSKTTVRWNYIIRQMLDSLGIVNGPSHCEFKFTEDGGIKVIETAARVVADSIWSAIEITTGVNWIEKSIDVAVGKKLSFCECSWSNLCGFIKFIITKEDHDNFEWLQKNHPKKIVRLGHRIEPYDGREVNTNGKRYGYYVVRCSSRKEALELAKPKAK
jgi:biotin carboxylase